MITYEGSPLNTPGTLESRVAEVRAFLEARIADGTVALDPNGTCKVAEIYGLYVKHAPGPAMGKKRFNEAMIALGSPSFPGNGNVRMRGGLRILTPPPAPKLDTWMIRYQKS